MELNGLPEQTATLHLLMNAWMQLPPDKPDLRSYLAGQLGVPTTPTDHYIEQDS